MALRYVLGPQIRAAHRTGADAAAAPQGGTPPAPAKPDVLPAFKGIDEIAWTAAFSVPAYDLAVYTKLAEIRVYLSPSGPPFAALPPTGDAWVASANPFTLEDVSSYQTGADVIANLPDVSPNVQHLGQVVYGYQD